MLPGVASQEQLPLERGRESLDENFIVTKRKQKVKIFAWRKHWWFA